MGSQPGAFKEMKTARGVQAVSPFWYLLHDMFHFFFFWFNSSSHSRRRIEKLNCAVLIQLFFSESEFEDLIQISVENDSMISHNAYVI